MCASIVGGKNPVMRSESKRRWDHFFLKKKCAPSTDLDYLYDRFECEHTCWDPKDGELCLSRVKSGETLMEARSGSDVQIDRQTWV